MEPSLIQEVEDIDIPGRMKSRIEFLHFYPNGDCGNCFLLNPVINFCLKKFIEYGLYKVLRKRVCHIDRGGEELVDTRQPAFRELSLRLSRCGKTSIHTRVETEGWKQPARVSAADYHAFELFLKTLLCIFIPGEPELFVKIRPAILTEDDVKHLYVHITSHDPDWVGDLTVLLGVKSLTLTELALESVVKEVIKNNPTLNVAPVATRCISHWTYRKQKCRLCLARFQRNHRCEEDVGLREERAIGCFSRTSYIKDPALEKIVSQLGLPSVLSARVVADIQSGRNESRGGDCTTYTRRICGQSQLVWRADNQPVLTKQELCENHYHPRPQHLPGGPRLVPYWLLGEPE